MGYYKADGISVFTILLFIFSMPHTNIMKLKPNVIEEYRHIPRLVETTRSHLSARSYMQTNHVKSEY